LAQAPVIENLANDASLKESGVSISPQAAPPVAAGNHQITGVLDAASFQALISPGSIASVFGSFTETTVTSNSIPLSSSLNGVSVTFNGIPGTLFGVFDGTVDQLNVQVPWNVDVSGGKIQVEVHWEHASGAAWSDPFEVDAALASPGIYMFPPGTAQAFVTNIKQSEDDDVIAGAWLGRSGRGAGGGDWERGHDLVQRAGAGQFASRGRGYPTAWIGPSHVECGARICWGCGGASSRRGSAPDQRRPQPDRYHHSHRRHARRCSADRD
jgi:hypothetical protein